MADWQKIRREYITGTATYRELAAKYGVGQSTLFARASKERWVEQREQHQSKTAANALEKISKQQSDRAARIDRLADKLLDKIEKAIDELNLQMCEHSTKEKIIEYNNLERPDKPTREVITETHTLEEVTSIVDRQGIRQLTAALADLKEIKMVKSKADEEEQAARIAALKAKAASDDDDEETGVILLPARREDPADEE